MGYIEAGLQSITPPMVANWTISRGYRFAVETTTLPSFPRTMFCVALKGPDGVIGFGHEGCTPQMQRDGVLRQVVAVTPPPSDLEDATKKANEERMNLDQTSRKLVELRKLLENNNQGVYKEVEEKLQELEKQDTGGSRSLGEIYKASFQQFQQVDEKEKKESFARCVDIVNVLQRIVQHRIQQLHEATQDQDAKRLCQLGFSGACPKNRACG